jgi:magnesium chelatase family protein
MLAIACACAVIGLEGCVVEVQVDFNPRAQLPSFSLVGLPDSAVRESRERVRAAIKNSSLQFPNKGYVVNLFPADLPKHSTTYDLAIAVGILAATDQIPLYKLEEAMFLGELSLDGSVRHTKGILPMAYTALQHGFHTVYVPAVDAPEAALVKGLEVIPIETLGHLVEHLYGLNVIPPTQKTASLQKSHDLPPNVTDFADVKGQEHVKRALEIAAAGRHNILMTGVPGSGKSLMARAMSGILPPLTLPEALEVTRIYSVADSLGGEGLIHTRPFRAPHHTTSQAGLVGGGAIPKPGEISLAHRGVLFLDEIVEYPAKVLEVLRQPIEDKIVTISRAKGSLTYPANFLLVGARNPCPCGHYGDSLRACTCTPAMIQRYQSKLSGPLIDRIDIHVDVPRVDYDKLMSATRAEPSASIRERVEDAQNRQADRFKGLDGIYTNADMTTGHIQTFCSLKPDAQQLLELSAKKMQLSARSYHRVLKLSRTIADLAQSSTIEVNHVAEAVQYRPKQAGF